MPWGSARTVLLLGHDIAGVMFAIWEDVPGGAAHKQAHRVSGKVSLQEGHTMSRYALISLNMTQPFLLRTGPDGKRQASWRVWVLIFVLPALFMMATAVLGFESLGFVDRAERTTGEVVRVYEWQKWNPWEGTHTSYGPVFRYEFSDDETTEASTGQASSNWGFEIGSRHDILFLPDVKGDVKLDNFETLWALPLTIFGIGLGTFIPALFAAWRVRRWLRGGPGGDDAANPAGA